MLHLDINLSEYGVPSLKVNKVGQSTVEIDLMDFFRNQEHLGTIYNQVNEYFSVLPDSAQTEYQAIIQAVYSLGTEESFTDHDTVKKLQAYMNRAVEILDLDRWRVWFRTVSQNLHVPDSVERDFVDNPDKGITKEKTYIYDEYIDLAGFIIFIRALSPLYIEYLAFIKQQSKHPYYQLFQMFTHESMEREGSELDKLRRYIDVNYASIVGNGKNEHLVIVAGLSDDDIIDYLISEVIFNKLLTIDFFNVPCNIVSYIFQTIRYKGNFRTSESAKLRATSSRGSADREDYSYFEDYRKTTNIPIGTVVEIQDALSDYESLAYNLGYVNFDFKHFREELKQAGQLSHTQADKVQLYVLGWFLHKVINPRALFHVDNQSVTELRLFMKTALLPTDQAFIGLFVSSILTEDDSYTNTNVIRNTLHKATVERLMVNYKHLADDNGPSIVENLISAVGKEINSAVWKVYGDIGGHSNLVTNEGYLEIPSNINDVITSYIDYVLTSNQ